MRMNTLDQVLFINLKDAHDYMSCVNAKVDCASQSLVFNVISIMLWFDILIGEGNNLNKIIIIESFVSICPGSISHQSWKQGFGKFRWRISLFNQLSYRKRSIGVEKTCCFIDIHKINCFLICYSRSITQFPFSFRLGIQEKLKLAVPLRILLVWHRFCSLHRIRTDGDSELDIGIRRINCRIEKFNSNQR